MREIWAFLLCCYIGVTHAQIEGSIYLKDTPKFITTNETYYVIPESDLDIVCQVTQSNPDIDIMITYDSFDMDQSKNRIFNIGQRKAGKFRDYKVIPLQNGVRLKIPEIQESESGYYKCSLATPKGSDLVVYTVRVGDFSSAQRPYVNTMYLMTISIFLIVMIMM